MPAFAHVVVGELEKMSIAEASIEYLKLGYRHILPLGLDHILFILSLFLTCPRWKPVLFQATAFTIAHTVTLGLSMYHIIQPPPAMVEPTIALSILFVAAENIFSGRFSRSRTWIVFVFGLIHGMGFASALQQTGLPQQAYFLSLIAFNAGVELGQVTVILAAFLCIGWFGNKAWYRKALVIPISSAIAITACYWTVERLFG